MIAHIVFEADSALRVGCGDANALFDSPIQRDFNEMPMILGTSLCGVIRNEAEIALGKSKAKDLFGDANGTQNTSSKLIFSNALILDDEMRVNERLTPLCEIENHSFLRHFLHLPQRQHNKIAHNGTCEDGGKFDEDIIFKGTRFKFSIEMQCKNDDDKQDFFSILNMLYLSHFRIGAGKSKGFGKINIININYDFLENIPSASLNETLSQTFTPNIASCAKFIRYDLYLKAENAFLFGSGFGDMEVDNIGVLEQVINYQTKSFQKMLLIPASSIKGAISHRTKFYINQKLITFINGNNDTARADSIHSLLFGCGDDSSDSNNKSDSSSRGVSNNKSDSSGGKRGRLLISDIYLSNYKEQIFAHNCVDRFSHAAKERALFQEKAYLGDEEFMLTIFVESSTSDDFQIALKAFENALDDICNAMLPLGAMSSKGHGFFKGKMTKTNKEA